MLERAPLQVTHTNPNTHVSNDPNPVAPLPSLIPLLGAELTW